MIDIEKLRRLLAEATPGPWDTDDDFVINKTHVVAACYDPENREKDAALIVAMRNALPQLLKAVEWQPIETAPKDGTAFIAAQDEWVYRCQWLEEGPEEGAFKEGWFDLENLSFEAPTHWMPLPLPPHGGGDVQG